MKKYPSFLIFIASLLAFILIGCLALYLLGPAEGEVFSTITEETPFPDSLEDSMNLTSTAFSYGEFIPAKYSCNGEDVSPSLSWTEPPAGTQSFALIMDDPDAPVGTWVHWVLFNLPASARGLSEGMPSDLKFADGSVQGITSARSHGYHGPCPPSGTHRYFFKLYALDTTLSLTFAADKKEVLAAMDGHILAQAELMGKFSK
ncbi:MAG TPA: YbhB/YbcL family Raf kinase inhibitor-like protein [Anaerolineales bacterium]|nr:YbhB/YbcL family Raf kinase inhibitor-like protein [Anaerolineales bacterium]